MRLSVITVVRNGADTIRHCLESVQRQEIPVEHIFVDGGSSDDTIRVLDQFSRKDCVLISQ